MVLPYLRFLSAHSGLLAFGFMLTFFSSFGQTFFIALFNRETRDLYGLTAGEFGALYAAATLTSALLMIQTGRQIDRWPLTWFAGLVVAGLGLATGLMAILSRDHVWMLFLGIVLLRLCGQGLMYHAAVTTAARAFQAQRGQAVSIVSLGFAAGEAVLPIAAVQLMSAAGWRVTWWAATALLVLAVLPSAVWLAHRHFAPGRRAAVAEMALVPANERSRSEVLRDPTFYLLLPAMLAPSFVNTGVFFHQVAVVDAKGWTLMLFASGFTTYAVTTIVMMLGGGRIIDRASAKAVLRFALLPLLSALLLLAYGQAPWVVHGYMLLAGATAGLYYCISTAVWAELYGVSHLGAIRAMTTGLMMVSTALAPPLMGWMIDFGIDMAAVMLGMAAYVLCAILLVTPALALHRASLRAQPHEP